MSVVLEGLVNVAEAFFSFFSVLSRARFDSVIR